MVEQAARPRNEAATGVSRPGDARADLVSWSRLRSTDETTETTETTETIESSGS